MLQYRKPDHGPQCYNTENLTVDHNATIQKTWPWTIMGGVWRVPCSLHVIDPFLEKEYRCILVAKKAEFFHPYPTTCTFLMVVKSICSCCPIPPSCLCIYLLLTYLPHVCVFIYCWHTSLMSVYLFIVEIVPILNMHDI
jgi:hypothetical protein